ncbi:MAG: putative phage-encoded protein [Streptosporangiaceae bacterium]|nr:putative phage-encoded protein [Streptosporangiaceae bacterium]
MTTAVVPFDFAGQQVRVVTDSNGEPMFVAADVARILDLGNARSSLALLDEDEKGVHSVDTPGGPQSTTTVTEAGLYSLILRSRKPEAKAFRRWVTHEVLPTIRRTGSYGTQAALPTPRELAVMLIAAEDAREIAEAKIAELEPKADLADTYLIAEGGTRKVREAAKLLRMRERDLRRFLIDEKLLFVRHARCGDAQYDFYAEFAHHFIAKETVVNHTFGTCSHYTIYITPRGIDLIRRRMAKVALPADEAADQLAGVSS